MNMSWGQFEFSKSKFIGGETQVAEDKASRIISKGERLDSSGGATGSYDDCGVFEENFPCMCKCYSRSDSTSGVVYKNVCPYCSIWTSLPDGASLEITHIFDCSIFGYGKRMRE